MAAPWEAAPSTRGSDDTALQSAFHSLYEVPEDDESVSVWETVGQAHPLWHFTFGCRFDRWRFAALRAIAICDSITVPLLISFGCFPGYHAAFDDHNFIACDFLSGVLYTVCVLLQLVTSVVDLSAGQELVEPSAIIMCQLHSVTFWGDLCSLVGNAWWFNSRWRKMAVLRLFRIWRLPSGASRAYDVAAGRTERLGVSVCELLGAVWLMAHIFGLAWFTSVSWGMNDSEDLDSILPRNAVHAYIDCLGAGTAALVGWSGPPSSLGVGAAYPMPEMCFQIISGPVASVFMAFIFARLLVVVDRAGQSQTKHIERMDQIGSVLASLGVPSSLHQRVLKYHGFLSVHNIDKSAYDVLFTGLSSSLYTKLKLFLFQSLVLHAPFFKDVPPDVVIQMVSAFEEEVFSPGDLIVRKGAIGHEMFFIIKGSCDILLDENIMNVVAVKGVGDYFGEIALVLEDTTRTAWVRAKVFCVLAKLMRTDFNRILEGTPAVKQRMRNRIQAQQAKPPPPRSEDPRFDEEGPEESQRLLATSPAHASEGRGLEISIPLSARGLRKTAGSGADLREQVRQLQLSQRDVDGKLDAVQCSCRRIEVGLGLKVVAEPPRLSRSQTAQRSAIWDEK